VKKKGRCDQRDEAKKVYKINLRRYEIIFHFHANPAHPISVSTMFNMRGTLEHEAKIVLRFHSQFILSATTVSVPCHLGRRFGGGESRNGSEGHEEGKKGSERRHCQSLRLLVLRQVIEGNRCAPRDPQVVEKSKRSALQRSFCDVSSHVARYACTLKN